MLLWLFVAIRVVANPCSNALQKLLTARGVAPTAVIALTHGGMSALVLPWLLAQPLPQQFQFWSYSAAAALLAIGGNWLIVEAVSRSDLSVLGPINSYKPVVSLAPAVLLLGERPGWSDLAGIGLVLAGSLLLMGKSGAQCVGLSALFADRGIQLRFLALILSAGEAVCLKRVLLVSTPGITFAWWAVLGLVVSLPFGLRPLLRGWADRAPGSPRPIDWRSGALVVTTGLMQYSTLVTFQAMPVGAALALFQLSTLLSVILGHAIFREPHFQRRLAGAAVMALGAALLIVKTGPLPE